MVVVTRPDERRLDEVETLAGVADVAEAGSDSELSAVAEIVEDGVCL